MASRGKANAGRSSTGSQDREAAWQSRADADVRENAADAGPSPAGPEFSMFGDGQSEAETQLYAWASQAGAARQTGFQPFAELNARLGEFEQPHRDSLLFPDTKEEEAPDPSAAPPGDPQGADAGWFEQRFGELKQLLSGKEEDRSQIAGINAKLAEIMARLDTLSAAMPNGNVFAPLEAKFGALSASLDGTAKQSAADAGRISLAAKEILAASTRVQDVPARFETAGRKTVEALGHTVVGTASRAAVLAAEHASIQMQRTGLEGVKVLESELRALNQQSRESGKRTEAALDRMHNTLRDFLERGQVSRGAGNPPPPKKRANVHDPISGDSAVYKRTDTGFGAAPARLPRLDTLLVRNPRPSDPSLFEALQDAEDRLNAKKGSNPPQNSLWQDAPQPFMEAADIGEEEKSVPLSGIAVVAFILLLVSGAFLYLHTAARIGPVHLSGVPGAQSALAPAPARTLIPEPEATLPRAAQVTLKPSGAEDRPMLLTAAEQKGNAESDLNALENAARQGDREAQFRIGTRFLNDTGLDGGAAKAARWLAKAAGQGHTEAQFVLASLFEHGAGVVKDEGQAIELYRKAATAGHIRAMHNLGVLLSARASPQDYREAASWFNQAALAGLAGSQYNLALLYERGLGIEQDLSRAYFWYRAAAKGGDREATKQAERLKRTLPAAETAISGEQAGTWRPVLEDSVHSANRGSVRG